MPMRPRLLRYFEADGKGLITYGEVWMNAILLGILG